jgi:hypothetical protein
MREKKTFTQIALLVHTGVACMLLSEADFSRPEPQPLIVFNRRIKLMTDE